MLVIQWFQAHITLFSKYFASFPHGTCSLSDSRRYLALDEIYHLFRAPIPGNATLRARTERGARASVELGCHHSKCLFPEDVHLPLRWSRVKMLQCKTQGPAFKYELFLLHSPLLEESFVVSFPPLTYMLKFRGYLQLNRVMLGKGISAQSSSKTLARRNPLRVELSLQLWVTRAYCSLKADNSHGDRSPASF